jgi:hypothetical protein
MTKKRPDQPARHLSDGQLDEASGGGQTGSDLLIVNNGDGSDFMRPDESSLRDETPTAESSTSDSEWKYVPVRRMT